MQTDRQSRWYYLVCYSPVLELLRIILNQKVPRGEQKTKSAKYNLFIINAANSLLIALGRKGHIKAKRLALISVDVVFLVVLNLGGSDQVRSFLSSRSSNTLVPAVKNYKHFITFIKEAGLLCNFKGIVKWQGRRGVNGINRIIMTSHTIADVF